MSTWRHKDIWRRDGKGFCVEVSRHAVDVDEGESPHRWCVYAYIYPGHPHFANFDGNHMWQDAACRLPLHGGPSFLKWHRDDEGKPTSVQVGADYNHLHDDFYSRLATKGDAFGVFGDADELYAWLANVSGGAQ